MIKLKDILFESEVPDIFIPRRIEDRVERLIRDYIRSGGKGDLRLASMNITKLPAILLNVTVDGNFYCYENNLTSLENSPRFVYGHFSCASNNLTSLKGSPEYVDGTFYCNDNKLTSLEGSPEYVGGFNCGFNKLTNLKNSPKSVDGFFACYYNNLTSLEGCPKFVGGDFYCFKNRVQFTEADVRAVCNVKGKIIV